MTGRGTGQRRRAGSAVALVAVAALAAAVAASDPGRRGGPPESPPTRWRVQEISDRIVGGSGDARMLVLTDSIGSRGRRHRHFGAIARIFRPALGWRGITLTTRLEGTTYDGSRGERLGATLERFVSPKSDTFTIPALGAKGCWIGDTCELRLAAAMEPGEPIARFAPDFGDLRLLGGADDFLKGPLEVRVALAVGADAELAAAPVTLRARRGVTGAPDCPVAADVGPLRIGYVTTTLAPGLVPPTVELIVGAEGATAGQQVFPIAVQLRRRDRRGLSLDVVGMSGATFRHWSDPDLEDANLVHLRRIRDYLRATGLPNVIVVALGQNDGFDPAAIEQDCRNLVARLRMAATDAGLPKGELRLLFVTPPRAGHPPFDRYAMMANAIWHAVRHEPDCGFIDVHALTALAWPTRDHPENVHPLTDDEADAFWGPVWAQLRLRDDPRRGDPPPAGGDGGPAEPPEEPVERADLDDDGRVDFNDLLLLLGTWGECPGCASDLDRDGAVGYGDMLLLLAHWTG